VAVDYIEKKIQGYGLNIPRYYKVIDDTYVEMIRVNRDCPCEDHSRHHHKLIVGNILFNLIEKKLAIVSKVNEYEYLISEKNV